MNIPVQNCSSCAACANVCTREAITMQLDTEGFYRPIIDKSKCIQCSACERACPWTKQVFNPNKSTSTPKTLAAYVKDEQIRLASSSGGIFSALARKIITDGGVVVGVAQQDATHFGHVIVDNAEDLSKLRGSKYVQANVGLVYKKIQFLLEAGKNVMFSGTPCQVAALYSVLGNRQYPNLYTVDVVCHGAPSVKVWEKYVKEIEQDTNGSVKQSFFRDKRLGWRLYSMTHVIEYSTGSRFPKSYPMNNDKYMHLFLQNICLNKSCTDCHYGKLPRIADITLGDYWNINKVHPIMDDDRGTSLVILNTTHGNTLLNSISDDIHYENSFISSAISGNSCITHSEKEHKNRSLFFEDINSYSLKELISKYCPWDPIWKRLYENFKMFVWKTIKHHHKHI